MKQGRCCTSRRNNRCIQRKKTTITINYERVRCEGVKGATADVRLFSCPLVAPAGAKSLRNKKVNSLQTEAAETRATVSSTALATTSAIDIFGAPATLA